MTPLEIVAIILMAVGSLFTLLAAIGVVRTPDFYCRLTTTSKAAPFGIGLVLVGAALLFGQSGFTIQAAAVGLFLVLTSPVAAHALARAAYRHDVPFTDDTRFDDEPDEANGSTAASEDVR